MRYMRREATRSSETSVYNEPTRRRIPEVGILVKNKVVQKNSGPLLGVDAYWMLSKKNTNQTGCVVLIIGVCILLRVILTVNNNTFCFATIDKVFY
jgi:hypothetical protein